MSKLDNLGEWEVNQETPCVVLTPFGRIGVNWSCNVDPSVEQRAEQVARLIAALPKLLEACRLALAEIALAQVANERFGTTAAQRVLEAAIAKAEGKA
jgi:hypothetical protein